MIKKRRILFIGVTRGLGRAMARRPVAVRAHVAVLGDPHRGGVSLSQPSSVMSADYREIAGRQGPGSTEDPGALATRSSSPSRPLALWCIGAHDGRPGLLEGTACGEMMTSCWRSRGRRQLSRPRSQRHHRLALRPAQSQPIRGFLGTQSRWMTAASLSSRTPLALMVWRNHEAPGPAAVPRSGQPPRWFADTTMCRGSSP